MTGHLFKWKVISSTRDGEFLHPLSCSLQDLETHTRLQTSCDPVIEFNHLQTVFTNNNCMCSKCSWAHAVMSFIQSFASLLCKGLSLSRTHILYYTQWSGLPSKYSSQVFLSIMRLSHSFVPPIFNLRHWGKTLNTSLYKYSLCSFPFEYMLRRISKLFLPFIKNRLKDATRYRKNRYNFAKSLTLI